jgi:hypothetical protein
MRERQMPEGIGRKTVHPCLVEDDLRFESEHLWQEVIDHAEVLGVSHAIREFNIDPALLFTEGKIRPAMNGCSEYIRIVRKDLGGSIALVNIKVDDCGATDAAL